MLFGHYDGVFTTTSIKYSSLPNFGRVGYEGGRTFPMFSLNGFGRKKVLHREISELTLNALQVNRGCSTAISLKA